MGTDQNFISQISAPAQSASATTDSGSMLKEDILSQIQAVALQNAQKQINDASPQLLKNLEDYAQQYTTAVLAGHPDGIPSVTFYKEDGTQLTKIDAKNRGFRTLLTGFGIDVLFAIIAGVGALSGVNFFDKAGLATLGILVTKTVVQTAVSYVARMKITPAYQKQ
jgi:hypothetical protein